MSARLQLVSTNPHPRLRSRLDGPALHYLADRLTEQVRKGNPQFAQVIAAFENLNPLGVAVVATWMTRAGLSEEQIIAVVT